MYRFFSVAVLLVMVTGLVAQTPSQSGVAHDPATDAAGLYSFVKEGESVQLTLDEGELSGYVTRFGDNDSDKGQLIDQFFNKGSLKDNHLSFATKTVHGVWYEFSGTVETQAGESPGVGRLSRTQRHPERARGGRERRGQGPRAYGGVQVVSRRREPAVADPEELKRILDLPYDFRSCRHDRTDGSLPALHRQDTRI